jgi:hypothetical protein
MLIPKLKYIFIYTCNGKYSRKDIRRFLSHIRINRETGCWEWIGYLDKDGYGYFGCFKNNKRITYKAHRVAIEMATGILIPSGIFVCHHCDNPQCMNTLICLFLGTHQDNMDDMIKKGRQPIHNNCGENNPNSTLNWIKTNEIRALYITGKYTYKQLGKIYNTTEVNIGNIIKNKIWYDPNYIPPNFENNGNRNLNWNKVNKIRTDYATGKYKLLQLAELFNTSISNISNIINNKTWKQT